MKQPDLELLDRCLAGTASPGEQATVRAWLARQAAEPAAPAGAAPAQADGAWDVTAAWERLQPRLQEPRTAPTHTAPVLRLVPAAPRRRWRVPLLAGTALAAAAAAVLVWRGAFRQQAPAAPMAELVTSARQRATLRLPDGTTVRLDAGSRLRYPSRLAVDAARELVLEGRAWFEVAHDPRRPFRVRAGGALVEDLGTEFTVAAEPGAGVRVVVVRGRVAVAAGGVARRGRKPAPPSELGGGQMARVDDAGGVQVSSVDVAPWLAWTHGVLAFEGRPLAEVAPELGRWYGVTVRVPDPALGLRPVTAEFRDQPLESVLDAIALTLGVHWQRSGDTVTFRAGARP